MTADRRRPLAPTRLLSAVVGIIEEAGEKIAVQAADADSADPVDVAPAPTDPFVADADGNTS